MRPLSSAELRSVFSKLNLYIGRNIEHLLADDHSFRLLKDRVHYASESLLKQVHTLPSAAVLSLGTCVGRFTKSGAFRLHVTALDLLTKYALHKVWLKPGSEMAFLYGGNVGKQGVGRITDAIPQYGGVVVLSMSDLPLGFGVAAQSTEAVKDLDPTANVVLHQADVGEYLRMEDSMW
ncbi:hypothetical protein TeGR_g7600 [Tetraparma gracilis]|uniref:60S ribosome subunit biogenesis protein NIP7 homolog n=1 Tax=Tetraparma gracilis TaxID=2962635 RepID=A0ABQ6NCI9_9STRA|nr:hypothetical protein TeGR_g7600 [Tetraparma gracilis]